MRRSADIWMASLLAAFIAGLRILLSRPLSFCGTPDACYYLGMARNLASGRGFHASFLYDFQLPHLALPNTGIEYWRPGISLILLLLKPLGGVTLHSSIVLTVLVGVLFATAAWHIAIHTYGNSRLAFGAFALCLLSSPVWVGSATPDSGLYYGAAVAWFLALFTVRRQGLLADLLALGCICLAYLIRNDAAILLLPLVAVLWQRRQRNAGTTEPAIQGSDSAGYAALMVLGFLLALLPMHLIYRHVLGTAFPPGAARTLYFNDLSDFNRYKDPASLHSLLSHGVGHLIKFRVATLATVVYRIGALMIGYPALVFLFSLLVRARGDAGPELLGRAAFRLPEWTGTAVFFATALFAYTMVLPAIGSFAALRSAVSLMPFLAVLTMVAIARTARTPRLAAALAAAVIFANGLMGLMDARRDLPAANQIGAADRAEAQALSAMGADPENAVVLTGDPVQFSVTTGYPSIALPNNGLDAIFNATRDLGVTHVILDTESLPASPADLNRRLQPVRSVDLPKEHTLILALPHP